MVSQQPYYTTILIRKGQQSHFKRHWENSTENLRINHRYEGCLHHAAQPYCPRGRPGSAGTRNEEGLSRGTRRHREQLRLACGPQASPATESGPFTVSPTHALLLKNRVHFHGNLACGHDPPHSAEEPQLRNHCKQVSSPLV